MAPMGRRLKKGDYVLLPKGSCDPPQDGIVYAVITDTCQLEKLNKFNGSVSKKKEGFTVQVITNDDTETITLDIHKTHPLIQYCSTELESELVARPKEFLGMFIGTGLEDDEGTLFINYGQVRSVSVRGGVTYCTASFRQLPNGDQIADMEFPGMDLMKQEVSLLQYTMGLGVGVPFACADRRVITFRGVLENMTRDQAHCQWIKNFRKLSPARSDQVVLDPFLEKVEIDLSKIVGNWPALAQYIPDVKVDHQPVRNVVKSLQFAENEDVFGECISGGPATPDNAAPMASQNLRRQNYRSSAIPQVLPLQNHPQPINPVGRQHVAYPVEGQHNLSRVEEQRDPPGVEVQRFQNLQVSESSSSSNQSSIYSKHSYHPTRAQLQKHMITFRHGAYGKSYSLEQATSGIEEVLSQELLHSVKAEEAYVRSFCIMMGDLTLAPYWTWRTAALLANNYEESYMPVKWTKLPELKAMEVTDIDDFWALYHSMQEAAARYYVDSYVTLLGRVRLNLIAGFNIIGGRAGFMGMRMISRKNVIHVLVSYLRVMVNKFVTEVLTPQTDPTVWMSIEATTSGRVYDDQIRLKLTTLQFTELAARSHGGGGGGSGGHVGVRHDGESKKEEWSSKMPKAVRDTIPKKDGMNICLLSYTNQGCKKENSGCAFHHKKAGSPTCPPPLAQWIEKTYGSFVGP